MKLESVGEIIATRELDIADSGAKVTVGMALPPGMKLPFG